ncbi:MAG: hypothetical protein RID91_19030 [Azospirillaceae bacterium]
MTGVAEVNGIGSAVAQALAAVADRLTAWMVWSILMGLLVVAMLATFGKAIVWAIVADRRDARRREVDLAEIEARYQAGVADQAVRRAPDPGVPAPAGGSEEP